MPEVTTRTPDGTVLRVHEYAGEALGEDYSLADIAENFQLGTADGGAILLNRIELRDLANLANAYSFDYPEGFIEMCLDIARAAAALPGDTLRFEADF